mmetsp:Transcript_105906/g.299380  ORF Transcript_105906/g.299380 Transcript_105906/m.299380 type:complete len:353 (-) Transcript_105906:216-1274(-)
MGRVYCAQHAASALGLVVLCASAQSAWSRNWHDVLSLVQVDRASWMPDVTATDVSPDQLPQDNHLAKTALCKEVVPVAGSKKPMPALGFGTGSGRGEVMARSAKIFLENGGRLIDTAQQYRNHHDISVALKESGVPRDEVWITSKVNVKHITSQDDVTKAVHVTLRELEVDYVDLMLLHGGAGWGVSARTDVELWKGLIEAKRAGFVRNIGVANHNRVEIQNLIAKTRVTPAVVQVEYHPWVTNQTKMLVEWCKEHGIAVTAFGSLGGDTNKAESESVATIAQTLGSTNAQVLLRWALDQGVAVIPGATTRQHILEDLNCTSHKLRGDHVQLLAKSHRPRTFKTRHQCISGC